MKPRRPFPHPDTETSGTGTDVPVPDEGALYPGLILGQRYEIREQLGKGGMGVVWLAYDLKLRVEVALKSIRPEHVASESRREALRGEVRAAREVVSPNVCRVFDLVVEGDHELVSMEYVDGQTLTELLKERAPLGLGEARDLASQFLSGLEAIHQTGLVHRDFKPENVMVTRAGRVVVMDLGIAKRAEAQTGTIVGTPAYMAPEQALGGEVDARADVFAAGVVLAEMTAPMGYGDRETRETLREGLRAVPPRIPEGPWAGVIRKAVSREARDRYASARELSRALDSVTLRVEGEEDRHPYPGLSAFTEKEAEHFFGREAEVEALLRKLGPARLLAIAGPSGAGKSSFVRAGLAPALPEGWRWLVFHPRDRPFASLAQALVPELSGDAETVSELLRIDELDVAVSLVRRWRKRHGHALLIADQFEELFTLSLPDVQGRFAELLGRLPLEADVHVLASMRDDFLIRCHDHESFAPIASEMTFLTAPTGAALRRALVQPALKCGYRFEDESLVEEMLGEVEKERGALPLLAFAAARLWEHRDREKGFLTREAYRSIGGVAGALAQHAEATLGRIGTAREPVVRELFRNLVTAQGTRAARERDELLSVFEDKSAAEHVLAGLIDARLLTSYEPPAGTGGEESRHRIEIVHESLLSAWPRLVRWQTQDADGAQLRDQLRQAARMWEERSRPEDLLWTGTSYREYELWRERYAGGLTTVEEAFGQAMQANATRRRRRRRVAVAAAMAVLALGLGAVGALWQRSEAARRRAEAEALRAEASKLVAFGDRELSTYPTGALAYAIKSLELADTTAGRLLALGALQRSPMARIARVGKGEAAGALADMLDFSPDGQWLATGGDTESEVLHRDGARRLLLGNYSSAPGTVKVRFTPRSDAIVTDLWGDIRIWSIPDGRSVSHHQVDEGPSGLVMADDSFLTLTMVGEGRLVREWSLDGLGERLVGTMEPVKHFSLERRRVAFPRGRLLYTRLLDDWDSPPRRLAEHPAEIKDVALDPVSPRVAASDASGEIRVWDETTPSSAPVRVLEAKGTPYVWFGPRGRWLAAHGMVDGHPTIRLWDTEAPSGAEPTVLRRTDYHFMNGLALDSGGEWLASAHASDLALWWIGGSRSQVVPGLRTVSGVAFTPDGRSLLSASADGAVRLWELGDSGIGEPRVLFQGEPGFSGITIARDGRRAVIGGRPYVVPLEGGAARSLEGFSDAVDIFPGGVFDDSGRFLAAAPYRGPDEEKVIRIWDLETGAIQVLGPMPGAGQFLLGGIGNVGQDLRFVGPDRILAGVFGTGLVSVDRSSGAVSVEEPWPRAGFFLNHAASAGLGVTTTTPEADPNDPNAWELITFKLDGSAPVPLRSHGPASPFITAAFDVSDRILATGGSDGIVRVGPATGAEPHLLLGHEGSVFCLAFSPDGRWLASGGADGTLRLWPVPDMSKTPLHKLPHDELLRKLRTHTNLRAVPDATSPTGYRLEPGPFPGWATPPEW